MDLLVVDVPISDKSQQSMSFENVEVPQFQFFDSVVDIPVMRAETCTHSANCSEDRRDPTGAVLGQCLRLASVVSASVCYPTLHEAHHLRVVSAIRVWLGNEYGFGRPSFEREVQRDVRVHSSSCGTHRDVTVPLNGCTIVATAIVVTTCASTADCPGSAAPMCCGGVCVAMSCGGGSFTPDGAYDSVLGQCEADDWKIFDQLFPVPSGRWVCLHAE